MAARRSLVAFAAAAFLLVGTVSCSSTAGSALPAAADNAASTASVVPDQTTRSSEPARSSSTSSTVAPASSQANTPKIMPDFVNGTEDEARAQLSDLNVRIKITPKIDAAVPGTVIEQDPVAGADFAQSVTLVVAVAPPKVPNVTGTTFGDAKQTLTNSGFSIIEKPVFDDDRADGLVIGQDPAAGTENSSEVTVEVVRRPVVTYLTEVPFVSNSELLKLTYGLQKSNGTNYTRGILVEKKQYTAGSSGSFEFDLSRQYRLLSGDIGLQDRSSSDATAKVEFFGDNRLLKEETVPFGTTIPVSVDVTDVLRLKITVSYVEGSGSVVFGDFKAQGLQSEVETTPVSGSVSTPTPAPPTTTTSR